jgi:hypothetical protein
MDNLFQKNSIKLNEQDFLLLKEKYTIQDPNKLAFEFLTEDLVRLKNYGGESLI